jgi:hypothetical protein
MDWGKTTYRAKNVTQSGLNTMFGVAKGALGFTL